MDLGGPEGSGVEILEEDEGQGVGTCRDEVAIPLFGTEKLEKNSGLDPHQNPGRETWGARKTRWRGLGKEKMERRVRTTRGGPWSFRKHSVRAVVGVDRSPRESWEGK